MHESSHIVTREDRVDTLEVGIVVEDIQRAGGLLEGEVGAAERDDLVEDRQGVAHSAVGLLSDEVHRLVIVGYALLPGNILQVADAVLDAYAVELEYLAPRQDRRYDLVLFGSGEDKDHMCGWFLEGLEEGVEGLHREHVDLVDDIYAVPADLRRDADLVGEGSDVVYRVV